MNRRLVLRLGAAGTLTLFYPSADSPPMTEEKFVRNIIADNDRLRRMMIARGWPAPTTYMGEGVDFQHLTIKKQYAGLVIQTSKGPRFALILLDGNSYRVTGVYIAQPDTLPTPSTVMTPNKLLVKNISWQEATELFKVM
jgi:hypothetical protein